MDSGEEDGCTQIVQFNVESQALAVMPLAFKFPNSELDQKGSSEHQESDSNLIGGSIQGSQLEGVSPGDELDS